MNYKTFARRLVSSPGEAKASILRSELTRAQSIRLAFVLRDLYYEAWTTEPAKTKNVAQVLKTLAETCQEKKIYAISSWVDGASRLAIGDIVQAIAQLDIACQTFSDIGDDNLAAQTKVSKLHGLALLGRYDEAIKCGKSALKEFSKHGDLLAMGKIHHNIGNIYDRRGLHDKAKHHQLLARKYFLAVSDVRQIAQIEHSLAITYSALNDFRRSEDFYKQALSRAHSMKMLATEAEIESTLGSHSLFQGRFGEALKYLEKSRQKYEVLEMPHQSLMAELEIADAYLELNLIREASEIYERIPDRLAELKMRGEEARARAGYARALTYSSRFEEARVELKRAAQLYQAEKNLPAVAFVKLAGAQLEILLNKPHKALGFIEAANKILTKSKSGKYSLLAKWLHGEALRETGRLSEAEPILLETAKQKNPVITQSSLVSLGKLRLQQKNTLAAAAYLKKAINLIETLRDPLPAEEFRMSFLASNLEPYAELAKINLANGKTSAAFGYVEQSRSRSLADSFGKTYQNGKPGSKSLLKIKKEMADLREELNWYYSRPEDQANGNESIWQAIRDREKKIAQLIRKSRSISGIVKGKSRLFDVKELQRSLADNRVLIEFTGFGDLVSAFVITSKRISYVDKLAKMSEIVPLIEGLQFQFGSMRYGAEHMGGFMPELKKRADVYLQKLHEKLLGPIEYLIKDRHLVVVPFRELHYVPFHALYDGEKYLVEKREVSYAPSATVLQHCLAMPVRKAQKALFLGFADEKIPYVYNEIKSISKLFKNSLTLTKKAANVSDFERNAARFDTIHIACHGNFRIDNPMFSSLKLYNGVVTARDISGLRLNAGLVALSACETGLNKIFAGDELLGLSRGFFAAGASSLLLTLWTVNDKASTDLMLDFYSKLKEGKGLSEALREAQCNFIKDEQHPYFWSPFFLTGRW